MEKVLFKRKIIDIGNSSGITIPNELMTTLKLKVGNDVAIFLNGDGIQVEKVRQ